MKNIRFRPKLSCKSKVQNSDSKMLLIFKIIGYLKCTFIFYLQLPTIYLVRMGHQPLLYLPLLCTARRCHLWHFYFLGRTLCILREPYRIKQASKTISDNPALGQLSVKVYFRAYFVMFNLVFIKSSVNRFSIHVLNKHTYGLKS